jgi:hypothetical protein
MGGRRFTTPHRGFGIHLARQTFSISTPAVEHPRIARRAPTGADAIGITVNDGSSNALLYSNNYANGRTSRQALGGGNLSVH